MGLMESSDISAASVTEPAVHEEVDKSHINQGTPKQVLQGQTKKKLTLKDFHIIDYNIF